MDKKVTTAELITQSLAMLCISLLACQTGYICAWPSYTTSNFESNSTLLDRPMSAWEISLLGSLPNFGALLASPFCGLAFNILGRKYATIFFGLPYVITWTIISLTDNVILVLVAMSIAGVGVAGQNVAIIYVSEIAHDSIRGGLTAFSSSGYIIGLLTSYILGGKLTYQQVVYTHLGFSVMTMLLLTLLRESPVFLVMKGREEEAEKSIAFYKRLKIGSKDIAFEIDKIRLQINPSSEKTYLPVDTEEAKDLAKHEEQQVEQKPTSSWKFLMKSKSSQRALATVLIIMTLIILMGCVVLQVYAEPLFKEAVPSMPPNQCAILLAVDFLIASLVCVFIIDKFGRKPLLIVTAAISGVCMFLLGLQLQTHFAPHWFTVLIIYTYSFVYMLGCAAIPFVLSAELFLPEVRSLCNSITMVCLWSVNFVTLLVFKPLAEWLGLGIVFYCFSMFSFVGVLFGYAYIPETKGLSVDAIQLLFLKKK
ncbi:facilitated trehalose transporter Tret1 isoform X5 [Bombyx mori]|uniref:Major facilitator superfamily (MFS) profile domain-containing protein n=1 Tax=Bombyx mori TaxID=7091 RepID=A0A8R2M478_BOMMO|nr:facilitated trehalose transporter Tret1 isoform X4 [Bombyx mori]